MGFTRGSTRPESTQQRAFAMYEAGTPIEEICDRFDKTKDEIRSMIYRSRKQRRMAEAAE